MWRLYQVPMPVPLHVIIFALLLPLGHGSTSSKSSIQLSASQSWTDRKLATLSEILSRTETTPNRYLWTQPLDHVTTPYHDQALRVLVTAKAYGDGFEEVCAALQITRTLMTLLTRLHIVVVIEFHDDQVHKRTTDRLLRINCVEFGLNPDQFRQVHDGNRHEIAEWVATHCDVVLVVPQDRPDFLSDAVLEPVRPMAQIRQYNLLDEPRSGPSFGTYHQGIGVLAPELPAPSSVFQDLRLSSLLAAAGEQHLATFLAYVKNVEFLRDYLKIAIKYARRERSAGGVVIFTNEAVDRNALPRRQCWTSIQVVELDQAKDAIQRRAASRRLVVTIVQNVMASHNDFLRLISRVSCPIIGCHGTLSLVEVILSGRIPFYQIEHQTLSLVAMCAYNIEKVEGRPDTPLAQLFMLFPRMLPTTNVIDNDITTTGSWLGSMFGASDSDRLKRDSALKAIRKFLLRSDLSAMEGEAQRLGQYLRDQWDFSRFAPTIIDRLTTKLNKRQQRARSEAGSSTASI